MEKLYLSVNNEVLRARQSEAFDKAGKVITWKNLQFEYTTSSLLMINWPIILPELAPTTARSLLDLVGSRYPFSPNYEALKELCPELIFSRETNEWVFFGGSFNPWHKGHQSCLNLLPEDKVCFILPDRNPYKELKVLEPVSTIIELVSKIKFGKNHFIAPTFLLDFQKNPTITWIEKLHKDFPAKKLSLLMGFDSLTNVHNWVRACELLPKISTLYVVSRLEEDEERAEIVNPLMKMAPQLKVEFLGRHDYETLSSTEIRKTIDKR